MQGSRFQLANTDAADWLRTLPSESIDLVVTDPPYESLEKHRAIGTTTRLKHSKASSNDWFAIFPNTRFAELFAEVHRVLKRDRHFYLYCDPETMFVAKPLAEAAGFRFWKPLIWDKCLGPDTFVWTERGTVRIADIVAGDKVALPNGGTTTVVATRTTKAPAVRLTLSDGTSLVASTEHRFMRDGGDIVETCELAVEERLATRTVRAAEQTLLDVDEVIPDQDAVHELPTTSCLWCGESFDGVRAAAAHQAWCAPATSTSLAERLGVSVKRLRWWMQHGRIPRVWAKQLGVEDRLGPRVRCMFQNDGEIWYPHTLPLDYELGKVIGLYAAEGSGTAAGVSFAFHAQEKHLHATIARFARSLGLRAHLTRHGSEGATVDVAFKLMAYLVGHFIGGSDARTKFVKAIAYSAPPEFRRGLLAGLIEGDGHWSHDEQHQTYTSAARDLVMFVHRELRSQGYAAKVRFVENDHAGAWVLRYDPANRTASTSIVAIEQLGEQALVDISIAHEDELFLLANGVVTHNCRIGMGYHYRARYECILFFEKGKRKLNDLGTADIIEHNRVSNGYPAEKPPEVSEVLITQSTQPGEIVIDPFMGSGSVGVAAIKNGRHFRGNDLCDEAIVITRGRLRELGADEAPIGTGDPTPAVGQLGLRV